MINSEALMNNRTKLIGALKTVIDPELQLNIVDLGLIYGVKMDQEGMPIEVEMTLSSRSCPMGESILSATKNCLERSFQGFNGEVVLVWEPEWNADFISSAGMRKLRGY